MLSKRKKDQKLRKFFYKSEKKIKINFTICGGFVEGL